MIKPDNKDKIKRKNKQACEVSESALDDVGE